MTTATKTYRYHLPIKPEKAIKTDCPDCHSRYRKTLSRYIDGKTGEPLPEPYGRCDRESNCGYHLSPYHKTSSGMSYAEEVDQQQLPPIPKAWFRIAGKQKRNGIHAQGFIQSLMQMEGATLEQAQRVANYVFDKPSRLPLSPPPPIYFIPDEVFAKSLGHYEQNQFARLLTEQFGDEKALMLLQQFQIGTSGRWPGACVFWLKDEQERVRAGQVVLFADDWHKARYTDKEGNPKVCISSVSHGLLRRYRQQEQTAPDWLTDYHQNAPRWPVLFGLHQLSDAPADQPVAIVEAPKTAVVCAAMMPDLVWMAVGALSYLNAERLAPLRNRAVILFPDLSKDGKAFERWSKVAAELNAKGYQITVSRVLEDKASDEHKQAGLDLADFLLMPEEVRPRWVLNGETIYGEVLTVEPCDDYPAIWDAPAPKPNRKPLTNSVDLKSGVSKPVSEGFPRAPLAVDALFALRRIRWSVIPDNIAEEDYNPELPTLIPSPNRERFANLLGLIPDQLPLYQIPFR